MSINEKALDVLAALRAAGVTKERISIGSGGFQAWTWEQVAPALGQILDEHRVRHRPVPSGLRIEGNSIWCHVTIYLEDEEGEKITLCEAWGDATSNAGPSAAMTAATRHAWTLAAALAEPDPLHKRNEQAADTRHPRDQPTPDHEPFEPTNAAEAKRIVLQAADDDKQKANLAWQEAGCDRRGWTDPKKLDHAISLARNPDWPF